MAKAGTYEEKRNELRSLVGKKRTKAQRTDYALAVKREKAAVKLLASWGFEPVNDYSVVFTDGTVYAHVALACNFKGEWIPQAWLVLSEEGIATYAGKPAPKKAKAKKGGTTTKTVQSDQSDVG